MPLNNKWPKHVPDLTSEQKEIKEDFYKFWLTSYLPKKLGFMEKFNQIYPIKNSYSKDCKTLEIGAGVGEHLRYENLENQLYIAMDLRDDHINNIKKNYPSVKAIVGDCQEKIDADDNFFDRIIAIHVLEHLPNLPLALKEINRVLKDDGIFVVIIPCEGGCAQKMGRYFTTRRVFEKRYGTDYDWFINSEHLNMPHEIISELKEIFKIEDITYYPIKIPVVSLNLCIGIVLRKITPE